MHSPDRSGTIGPYHVIRRLGAGGTATVLEAVDHRSGKRVALKLLRADLLDQRVTIARFLREGRIASCVVHPHVVSVLEIGEASGFPYLAMELLEGEDLASRIRRSKLSIAETTAVLLPVISALSAAHRLGVVHRDLKPSNIFLARGADGLHPKILDFGVCKRESDAEIELLTQTQSTLGTLEYMAPEQVKSPRDAGPAADQWSVGVILYQALTGRRPFEGRTPLEVMRAIMSAPITAPGFAGLDTAILRALAREPSDRFPSVEDLGVALLPFADASTRSAWDGELDGAATLSRPALAIPIASTIPDAPPAELPRRARGRSLIAVAVAILAVVMSLFFFDRDPPAVAPTVPAPMIEARATPEITPREPPPVAPPEPGRTTARPKRRPVTADAPKVEPPPPVPPKAAPALGENGAPILE
jgi:serine/threonine-protein kinase